jgi:hypothetical protein
MVQIRSLLGAMQARGTVSAGEPGIKQWRAGFAAKAPTAAQLRSGAPEFVIFLDCLVTLATRGVR